MEHEAVPEPPSEPEISTGPTTEEREAIAEQPTEMYDIEEELASSQAEAPSEEELVEEEMEEPRLAPVDPLAGLDDDAAEVSSIEDEEDDDFWDEKRLSDELDQALEAPVEVEEEEEEAVFEPEPRRGGAGGREACRRVPTRTCSRRPPTSSRRLPRTTSSGSSRNRRRTSTSTTEDGASRVRTGDLLLAKQALFQLSYGPSRLIVGAKLAPAWTHR